MKKRIFIIVLLIITIFYGCQEGKLLSVPDELVGVWKTADPRYPDSSFKFTHSVIIFGHGEGDFDSYTIDYVKMKRARDNKNTIIYTIFYNDKEGEKYRLTLFYYPEDNRPDGVITVKYQEHIVWKRQKDT